MTLKELQEDIKARLDASDALVKGGCLAICEDALTAVNDIQQQLTTRRGLALVVATPEATRDGVAAEGIQCEVRVRVVCLELPGLRATRGRWALTALAAAQLVARALDGADYCFEAIRQTSDEKSGTLRAEATFRGTAMI